MIEALNLNRRRQVPSAPLCRARSPDVGQPKSRCIAPDGILRTKNHVPRQHGFVACRGRNPTGSFALESFRTEDRALVRGP